MATNQNIKVKKSRTFEKNLKQQRERSNIVEGHKKSIWRRKDSIGKILQI